MRHLVESTRESEAIIRREIQELSKSITIWNVQLFCPTSVGLKVILQRLLHVETLKVSLIRLDLGTRIWFITLLSINTGYPMYFSMSTSMYVMREMSTSRPGTNAFQFHTVSWKRAVPYISKRFAGPFPAQDERESYCLIFVKHSILLAVIQATKSSVSAVVYLFNEQEVINPFGSLQSFLISPTVSFLLMSLDLCKHSTFVWKML